TRQTSLTVSSVGFVKFRQCSFRVTFRTGTEKVQHGIGDRGPVRFPLVWDAQMYPAALVDFSHCIPGTTGTGRGSNVRMFGQSKSLVVPTVRRCTPRSLMKMSLRPTRNAVVVQSVRNIRPMSVHTTGTSFPLARPKRRPAMWRSSQPKPNAASTADIIGRWWYSGTTRRHVNIRRWCPDRWTPGTGGKVCFSLVSDSLPKRGESAPRGACAVRVLLGERARIRRSRVDNFLRVSCRKFLCGSGSVVPPSQEPRGRAFSQGRRGGAPMRRAGGSRRRRERAPDAR